MILGIIMIVLASRLIRTPSVSDNGVIADRKGIVIFLSRNKHHRFSRFDNELLRRRGNGCVFNSGHACLSRVRHTRGTFPQRKTRRQLRKKNKQLQRQLLSCRVGSAFGRSFCFCTCIAAFCQQTLHNSAQPTAEKTAQKRHCQRYGNGLPRIFSLLYGRNKWSRYKTPCRSRLLSWLRSALYSCQGPYLASTSLSIARLPLPLTGRSTTSPASSLGMPSHCMGTDRIRLKDR